MLRNYEWIELIINILLALFCVYILFEFYRTFFEIRRERKRIGICLSVCTAWQILSLPYFSVNFSPYLRLFLNVLFVAMMGGCFYCSFAGQLIFAIIYNTIGTLSELFIASLFLNFNLQYRNYSELEYFICELFLLILVKILQVFFRNQRIIGFSWKHHAILMLMPIGCIFISAHLFSFTAETKNHTDLIMSTAAFIVLLVIVAIMFLMYIRIIDSYETKKINDIYRRELELYTEHMREKEAAMKEFRKSRHDFDHKLLYISQLIQQKQYEELSKYIDEISNLQPFDGFMVINTDHSLIDAQLNFKYEEARKNGITFKYDIDIPSMLPFDSADLCVILGNALDNAIEANAGGKVEQPYIKLIMKYRGENLLLIIENSYDGIIKKNLKGEIQTRKTNSSSHGFGLYSIQSSLEKYHGDMNIEMDDGIFKLTIIMYPPDE